MEMIGAILLLIGSLFFLLSSIGLLRMPDVFNRIQAGTKATTLGTILFLMGLAFIHPNWAIKLSIILLFILLTNPISSHIVARAAHGMGDKMATKKVEDTLKKRTEEGK